MKGAELNGGDSSWSGEQRLVPVTGRPGILTYIRQLFEWRYFIHAEAKAKAYSNARDMLLGRAWLLLAPLLDAGVYGLIFGVVLQTSRGVDHFIPFLVVGVIFFSFSLKHLNGGCGLINARRSFIKAFSFPKAALVFSHSLRFLYDSIPVVLMAFVAITIFPQSVAPSVTWLLFFPVFLLQSVLNLGLMFIAATLTFKVPDFKQLVPYIARLWFYASGVFFSIDQLSGHSQLKEILSYNPGQVFLNMYRDVMVYETVPMLRDWWILIVWSFGLFLIGFVVFWKNELSFGRVK